MYRLMVSVLAALVFSMTNASASDVEAGARAWAKCSACHSVEPGVHGMLGPNLYALIGRKVGTLDGYRYSPAMKDANFVWDAEMLDAFIKAPQEKIPGTRMAFSGLKDSKDRAAVVHYLSSQHP